MAQINVQNFGQFDQDLLDFAAFQAGGGGMGGGLAGRPSLDVLPIADQWVAAGSHTLARRERITLQDVDIGGGGVGGSLGMDESAAFDPTAELDDWGPFNPLDETGGTGVGGGMGGGGGGGFDDSGYSDVELARDADGSRRRSSFKRGRASLEVGEEGGGKGGGRMSDYGLGAPGEEEELYYHGGDDMMDVDDGGLPPPEEEEEGGRALPDLSLGMEGEGHEEEGGGGEVDMPMAKKPKKAPRKPRKLKLDETTILSTAQIKTQLQEYEDIIQERVRPRDRGVVKAKGEGGVGPRMKAPTLAGLSEDLVEVFQMTMVVGAFELEVAKRAGEGDGEEEEEEIEQARAGGNSRRESAAVGRDSLPLAGGEAGGRLSKEVEEGGGMEEDMMMMQDDDFRMDDDYLPPPEEEEEGAGEGGMPGSASKRRSSGLGFEGGMLIEEEGGGEEEEDDHVPLRPLRQQEEEPTNFVWHPNTVKILTFLRKQLKGKQRQVSLQKLAAEANRANVAKFFWELLQLKVRFFLSTHPPGSCPFIH